MSVTLPYSRTQLSLATRDSNYLAPYNVMVESESFYRNGAGNKRLHWSKLPQPQRGSPLAYSMRWNSYRQVRTLLNHTEQGPNGLGGIQFNYSYERYYSSGGDPYANRSLQPESEAGYMAKARLFDKLKGEGTNVANMLGERKQIVKQVEGLLNTLVYTARDLRRGNIASAIRRMGGDPLTARKLRKKDIANQWLSLQYGWKPLISDVYGLVTELHQRSTSNPYTVITSFAKSTALKASPEIGGGLSGNLSRGMLKTECQVSYMVRARPNETIASLAALGVTNPAVVAWEITPWSFVVDWFIPVGRYIEQFSAADGWYFYDGCVSVLTKCTETAFGSWFKTTKSGAWTYNDSRVINGELKSVVFSRSVLSSWPIPDIPHFKNPISAAHIMNGIALLSQLLGRK